MKPTCPHIPGSVGALSTKDFEQLISVRECDVCRLNIGKKTTTPCEESDKIGMTNLWLCLYADCYMLGCSDDVQGSPDHSTKHQDGHQHHHIQLNITTKKVWCYGCVREITTDMSKFLPASILEVHPRSTKMGRNTSHSDESTQSSAAVQFGKPLTPKEDDAFVAKGATISDQEMMERSNGTISNGVGGLVGLSNLGNTCYMNAGLQCLSNIPALSEFFLTCPALVACASTQQVSESGRNKTGVAKAYMNHVKDIWTVPSETSSQHPYYGNRYIAPSRLMISFKNAFPMFRGFHQHDAQEFLRCFLDQLHEELAEPMLESNTTEDMSFEYDNSVAQSFQINTDELHEGDLDSVSEYDDDRMTPELHNPEVENYSNNDINDEIQPMDEQEYETADSGVSEQSNVSSNSSRHKSEVRNDGILEQHEGNQPNIKCKQVLTINILVV